MLNKSFVFAFLIIVAISGANSFEKPVGLPLLRKVILVVFSLIAIQVYVVSIRNGPSVVLIINFCRGMNSTNL